MLPLRNKEIDPNDPGGFFDLKGTPNEKSLKVLKELFPEANIQEKLKNGYGWLTPHFDATDMKYWDIAELLRKEGMQVKVYGSTREFLLKSNIVVSLSEEIYRAWQENGNIKWIVRPYNRKKLNA